MTMITEVPPVDPYEPDVILMFEVWEPMARHPLIITSDFETARQVQQPGDRIVKRRWAPAERAAWMRDQ